MKSLGGKIVFVGIIVVLLVVGFNSAIGERVQDRLVVDTGLDVDLPEPQDFAAFTSAPSEEGVIEEEVVPESEPETVPETEPVDVVNERPASFNLAVPFTPQAPFANWDEVHQDTCEEASILMVDAFYQGGEAGLMDPDAAEEVLLAMVERQQELFGYFKDTTAQETAELAQVFFGYPSIEMIEAPTVEQIQDQLLLGRPVIVPAAGQILANPFYSGEGPTYHMLVIRGYTPDGFVTNDPGTRRGENWFYSYDTLMSAIHDWGPGGVAEDIDDRPQEISPDRRVVFVIIP